MMNTSSKINSTSTQSIVLGSRASVKSDDFNRIVRKFRPHLMRVAGSILHNNDDASDAVQETFLKAYNHLPSYREALAVKPWLDRICINTCLDTLRTKKRSARVVANELFSEMNEMNTPVLDHSYDSKFEVSEAMLLLPLQYRAVFLMRHVDNQSIFEIAVKQNCPVGTVKCWLFRSRNILRKSFLVSDFVD